MKNPELQRHVWLEITPARLIAMPALLGVALLLVHLLYLSDPIGSDVAVSNSALLVFAGLVYLWGCRLVADSMLLEISGHTWDWQRMSPISPWTLCAGKLLGGPVYAWYGGTLCLAMFFPFTPLPLASSLRIALIMVLSGVLLHGLTLIGCLQAIRKERRVERSLQSIPLAFGAIGLLAAPSFIVTSQEMFTRGVTWYGFESDFVSMLLYSIAGFAIWAVVGSGRLIRVELQMRSGPLLWLGFEVFLLVWIAGFVHVSGDAEIQSVTRSWRLSVTYVLSLFIVLGMAFSEPKNPLRFHRLQRFARTGEWQRFGHELPRALVSLVPVVVLGFALLGFAQPDPSPNLPPNDALWVLVLSSMFLLMRDLALLFALNFSNRPEKADIATVVYLAFLYLVLPGIAEVLDSDTALIFFWPIPRSSVPPLVQPFAIAIQSVAALAWARYRYRGVARDWPKATTLDGLARINHEGP